MWPNRNALGRLQPASSGLEAPWACPVLKSIDPQSADLIGVCNGNSVANSVTRWSERRNGLRDLSRNQLISLVGTAGFELATPCTPCKCATRLRYAPTSGGIIGTSPRRPGADACAPATSRTEQIADREQFGANLVDRHLAG